jgi:putative two-component system response regulator
MCHLLYVNDDPEDLYFLREQLAEAGCCDAVSYIPERAPEIIRYLEENRNSLPDGILIDARLPVYDGIEIVKAIRLRPEFEHVPIVLISGSEFYLEKVRREYPEIRIDGYMTEPLDVEELQAILLPLAMCA